MKYKNIAYVSIISSVALLSGCQLPEAEIVSPDTSVAMQPVKFDMQFTDASDDIDDDVKSYLWDFGDGQTLYGKSAYHVFTKAGTYDVTLSVFGKSGQSGSVTKRITVTEQASSLQSPLVVKVRHNDVFLANAEVSIGDTTLVTDAEGKADFGNFSADTVYTVNVKKDGFLDQTYRVEPSNRTLPHELHVRLKPTSTTNTKEETLIKTTISEATLNTKVTYNKRAFSNSNANVVVTPASFDSESDRYSFAGNTRALYKNGEVGSITPLVVLNVESNSTLNQNDNLNVSFETPLRINSFLLEANIADGINVSQFYFDEDAGLWIEQGEASIETHLDKDIISSKLPIAGKWAWIVEQTGGYGSLVQTKEFCPLKQYAWEYPSPPEDVELDSNSCFDSDGDGKPDACIVTAPERVTYVTKYVNATSINYSKGGLNVALPELFAFGISYGIRHVTPICSHVTD